MLGRWLAQKHDVIVTTQLHFGFCNYPPEQGFQVVGSPTPHTKSFMHNFRLKLCTISKSDTTLGIKHS